MDEQSRRVAAAAPSKHAGAPPRAPAPVGAGRQLGHHLAVVGVPAERAVVLPAGEQERRLEGRPRHREHPLAVGVELAGGGDGVAEIPDLRRRSGGGGEGRGRRQRRPGRWLGKPQLGSASGRPQKRRAEIIRTLAVRCLLLSAREQARAQQRRGWKEGRARRERRTCSDGERSSSDATMSCVATSGFH